MGVTQLLSKLLAFPLQGTGKLQRADRANRVAPALSSKWERELGVGQSWMPLSYGDYYPRSALVYSAVKVRQDAVARAPLKGYRRLGDRVRENVASSPDSGSTGPGLSLPPRTGEQMTESGRNRSQQVAAGHPVQRLLDSPNPFWARGDLWRATETFLSLWGSAFWGLERDVTGSVVEIWPLRSDKMRVIPDPQRYVKGFVYVAPGRKLISYVPDDIMWIRYFNPLDEYAGLSPIAPLRLSADMGLDALRSNRNALTNDSTPGLFIETSDTPTDDEVNEFYERWESRFKGPSNTRRPALLSAGMKATNLGFSPREMEYLQSMRWGLEDVARVYGVPKAMMGDIERLSFSNFVTARRVFWEDTIVPQLISCQEALNQRLLPLLGDPTLFVEFDIGAIEALRESENDKARRRQLYVSAGIMTVNEVRQEMNLPPVPERDGG